MLITDFSLPAIQKRKLPKKKTMEELNNQPQAFIMSPNFGVKKHL